MCPQCGFDWTLATEAGARPRGHRLRPLLPRLRRARGSALRRGGPWSPREYLWHVVDVLRHGTENLWMLAVDPDAGFAPWREHDVMAARSPSPMSTRVGLWALAVASGELDPGAHEAPPTSRRGTRDEGWVTAATCCGGAAHEVVHHENDVRWGLA